jgi:hypothetical protein
MSDFFTDQHLSLRERLSDWTDIDVAMYHLGQVLGVLPPLEEGQSEADHWAQYKAIFWTSNGLSALLCDAMDGLDKAGVIERQPDADGVVTGPSAVRIRPGLPTEHDEEFPPHISPCEHYMALVNGLLALRALEPLPDDIETYISGAHARFWGELDDARRAQLEHDIEVAMYRWKSAFSADRV